MTSPAPRHEPSPPPSERPAGHRGPRGPVAAIAAFVGLVPLSWAQFFDETSWAQAVMLAAGAALIGGALILWTARRRLAVWVAFALVVLGVAGGVLGMAAEIRAESTSWAEEESWAGSVRNEPRAQGAVLSREQAERVPMGLTPDQLRKRLGKPATSGIQRITDGPDMRCLGYRSRPGRPARQTLHAFCFRNGSYEELGEW
jgi:hypothetical protein